MRASVLNLIALAAATLSGCYQVSSHDVPTEEMTARISVTIGSDSVADVSASLNLRNHGLAYVDMSPGERIFASTESERRQLYDSGFGYETSMPISAFDTQLQVSIERTYGDSALDNFVTIPEGFELYVTSTPSEFGDSDRIDIDWDRLSDAEMMVRISGPCIYDYSAYIHPFEDEGYHSLYADELQLRPRWEGQLCPVEVTVERTRTGVLDWRLSGGSFEVIQQRVEFISIYQ